MQPNESTMIQKLSCSRNFVVVLLAALLQAGSVSVEAYLPASSTSTSAAFRRGLLSAPSSTSRLASTSSSSSSSATDFSTFANSLESDFDDDDETSNDPMRASAVTTKDKSWQAKLDDLLDPSTNLADRQILLSELLTANDEIRDDVLDALTNRKVRACVRACCVYKARSL
jgi:hypothetical protein